MVSPWINPKMSDHMIKGDNGSNEHHHPALALVDYPLIKGDYLLSSVIAEEKGSRVGTPKLGEKRSPSMLSYATF